MGKFIAIDGLDGSGKGTQSDILCDYVKSKGFKIRELSFPVYENDSSIFVRMYLDGQLGSRPSDTSAYAASMFFAADRYISYKTDWKKDIDDPSVFVLANRYTTANAVHQLSKLPESEWESFLDWLVDFEFGKLALPSPDLVLFLELLPELSISLVEKRSRETGRKMDIHEKDKDFIKKSYSAAIYAAEKLGWVKIKSYDEQKNIRSIEDVAADVMKAVIKIWDV